MVEETKAAEKPEEEKPDAKAQVAAAKASAKSAKVPMAAPDGAKAVVDGTEYKAAKGRVEVAIEHVEALIAHGFEVIVKEVEKL